MEKNDDSEKMVVEAQKRDVISQDLNKERGDECSSTSEVS